MSAFCEAIIRADGRLAGSRAGNSEVEGRFIPETTEVQAKTGFRRITRAAFTVAIVLLVCGFVAPLINAARFSGRIKNALEFSLGRKVDFEQAHFSVFSGPGFSLENVRIGEDPRYGIELFAYVPTLEARLRLDKLLIGRIQFASLRLVDPSLNLVNRADGNWNVVELMKRLSAPPRLSLNLFPALEVSDGRVDFKFGTRKTTLYISESDLSIYPEHSGKIYIRFSGSPARTDRAGMGFGHFRGSIDWFINSRAGANQVQAAVTLDPSNLSELATLIQGHDIGIHGTISSQLRVEGLANELKVIGELHLRDVHRWDLLPSSGEDWAVHFGGGLDLLSQQFDLRTLPPRGGQSAPVAIHLRVGNFLTEPVASVVAELKDAPLRDLLPLARRMGVPLPNKADLRGTLNGSLGYSKSNGWRGGLIVSDAQAILQGAPTLRTAAAGVAVDGEQLRFNPAIVETGGGGTLRMSGSYSFADQQTNASFSATDVPLKVLKPLMAAWFDGPPALAAMSAGNVTGQFGYSRTTEDLNSAGNPVPALWSGQFNLRDGVLTVPGLAYPLLDTKGRVSFRNSTFEFDRLNATLANRTVRASYRYSLLAKHTEQVRIEFPSADISELEAALGPDDRTESFWNRLRFFRRSSPAWLSNRNLEGELRVDHLFSQEKPLGVLTSHFLWQGARLELSDVALRLNQGEVSASGTVDLRSYAPRWHFSANASGFPWSGGMLNAEGEFSSAGAGKDLLRNLTANGTFSGEDLSLSQDDVFENAFGLFAFSFADGWPDLRLSDLHATQAGEEWTGDGATQSDGKLLVNLVHNGRQMHFVRTLAGDEVPNPLSVLPRPGSPVMSFFSRLEF